LACAAVMNVQGGAVMMAALPDAAERSGAAAVMMAVLPDAAERSGVVGKDAMAAQSDAAERSGVMEKEAMAALPGGAARSPEAALAVKVARYCAMARSHEGMAGVMTAHHYLMAPTLSREADRDGEIHPVLPIRAHNVASRDVPVEKLKVNYHVYDPTQPVMVTRRVKVGQQCGPASSDRQIRRQVRYSSSLPSSLPFFLLSSLLSARASPEGLSVQPGENLAHAGGDRGL
jgi:hypothetical protein